MHAVKVLIDNLYIHKEHACKLDSLFTYIP